MYETIPEEDDGDGCDTCSDSSMTSSAEGSAKTTAGSVSIGGAFGGKSRDEDGTIDRVPDPPETLKKWLLTLKRKNSAAGIDMLYNLRVRLLVHPCRSPVRSALR